MSLSSKGHRSDPRFIFLLLTSFALSSLGCASLSRVPCDNTLDCNQVGVAPACSEPDCTACDPLRHRCVYRLKVGLSGCPCLPEEIATCNLSGGGKGIKKCVQKTSTTSGWTSCKPLD